jgi:hypothetical protein
MCRREGRNERKERRKETKGEEVLHKKKREGKGRAWLKSARVGACLKLVKSFGGHVLRLDDHLTFRAFATQSFLKFWGKKYSLIILEIHFLKTSNIKFSKYSLLQINSIFYYF